MVQEIPESKVEVSFGDFKELRPDTISCRESDAVYKKLEKAIEKMLRCPVTTKKLVGYMANERDCAVSTLRCLNLFYGFNTETFATAVHYLDRFLSKVNVQSKYLSCLAATCYYIAVKIHEEPEELPLASELAFIHRQTWTSSDLKRMESVILKKLDWDLWPITCPVFIRLYCDILNHLQPAVDEAFFNTVLQKFEVCINYNLCAIYSPAILAFCLTQLTLKESGLLTQSVCNCLLSVHDASRISDSELFECQATVIQLLNDYSSNPKSHPACLPLPKPAPRLSLISRPSLYGDTDLPTIEEEISLEETYHINYAVLSDVPIQKLFNHMESWSLSLLPSRSVTNSVREKWN